MKKVLAWALAVVMLASLSLIPVGAADKMDPTTLKDFKETRGWDIVGDHSKSTVVDGHIQVRPSASDSGWELETEADGSVKESEEGKFIEAFVRLDIAWYLRMNNKDYTSQSLTLDQDLKYLAYKVKQGNNYTEDPVYEVQFTVPMNPDQPRGETGTYWLYSSAVITAEDGYDYIVFDASTSDDYDMWAGPLSLLQLKWASRDVTLTTKDEAWMDIYEICFFDSEEAIETYVGSEIDWEAAFAPTDDPETEEDTEEDTTEVATESATESATTTSEGDDKEKKSGGCGSFVASASVLAVLTMAAGVVVCKKKED